jgi:hypothetical protein
LHVKSESWSHSSSGSAPAAIGSHTPFVPYPFFATEQAAQSPPHAVPQQTLSAQKPLAHSAGAVHVAPVTLSPVHTPPAHVNCPQLVVPPSLHVPAPLQVSGLLTVVGPAHPAALHSVLLPYLRHAFAPLHMPS